MNSTVLALNRWAEPALAVAWPMLWQSSLLIAFLFALDFAFRRRVRASVRYALWLVVLVKLVLPPSLALPTGLGWWLRPAAAAPARPHWAPVVVSYGPARDLLPLPPEGGAPVARPPARLSAGAWGLAGSGAVSLVLLGWMLARWRQVAGEARGAVPAPDRLEELFVRARGLSGLRRPARVRLIARPMSPAVCGLFRPVILLPRVLAEQLPPHQLRAVLLHELVHLRRGDLWLSFAQALLQIVYWWHPLLWAANARIRRAREEAVDDAVMLALEDQAEAYAPTLVQVARLALARPPVSLGLVGILESGSFLRQRVERLLDFHPPRKAGLTLASVFSVAAFAALALPMGQAPAPAPKPEPSAAEAASAAPATSSAPATAAEEHRSSRSEVLLQDGKLLYQMGKLDEAEAKLEEARGLDPLTHGDRLDPLTHGDRMTLIQTLEAEGITLERYFRRVQAVDYYLKLIREARSKEALKKGDNAGTAPPQVSIQAVFIELPRAEVESFWEKFGSANGPASGGNARAATLTHAQAAAQLDRWKSMGGKNILGQFRVTTLSGRQAQVSLGDWETTMTNVGQGQAKPELIPHALEITPRTTDDDPGVKMDLNATLWEFLGYAASPQTVTVIGEQAMRLERELKTHQERLQNFLLSNNVVRLQEQGSSAGAEAAKRSKELASLRTEVKLLEVFTPEQLAQTIGRSRTGSDDGFSPFSQGIADDLSSHLVGPLADLFRASQQTRLLRAKREEVAEFLMPSHPKILKLDRYIAEQEAIVEVVKRQSLAYIADTRAALARQITNLESSVGEWEQKAVDASRKMAEYERLKQDVKRAQDLYGRLLRLVQNLDAGNSPIANGTNAVPVTATSSLPHFRVLHAAAAVEVQDGQTVVLGDLAGEDVSKLKDQVPVLKDLLILVTPTLVDPAGNRIHPQSK